MSSILTPFFVILMIVVCSSGETVRTVEHNETHLPQTLQDLITNYVKRTHISRYTCQEDEGSPLDEFAEIFTEEQLRHGWVVLHVFAVVYFFILLAMIVNDYFLPTVERICNDLHLPKDVAAATFMATATSMPEFFTNTISTLLTKSDLGLGTIIGSLLFNTLGVAALAALAIKKPVQLDWWPIARDCCIYGTNTLILLALAWGGKITFVESCIMMGFLVLYYIFTFNSNRIMPIIRVFIEDKMNCCFSTRYDLTQPPENSAKAKLPLKKDPLTGNGLFVINLPADQSTSLSSTTNLTQTTKSWYEERRESLRAPQRLFALPRGQSKLMQFWWAFTFPINFVLCCFIPNPAKFRKLYPLSFIMCIVAIGLNAYLIVWMMTAFGVAIQVPTIVMGLTFLAAGSNMPEAVSSLIALHNGENGIGVSNSLGANSLAILLSLGVPWFIKNCLNYSSESGNNMINIATQGIEYSIGILFLATVSLFVVLSMSGYRLTKRVGFALVFVYTIFIVLQVLIEMNVFFPKQC